MAVGEVVWPQIHAISGVRLGVAAAGIKYRNRHDIVLFELAEGSRVAGVFTQNAFCAAPVTIAKHHMAAHSPRYLLVNSGNANACTGEAGHKAAMQSIQAVAGCGAVASEQVLPFSTGVIGEILPAEKIAAAIPAVFDSLDANGWRVAAEAIMTTDTRPKAATHKLHFEDGSSISITGIAKGAGMIRPNMATMLAYIATDADISQEVLDQISRVAANKSFNRITIDGDTSTNDACMLMATAQSKAPALNSASGELYNRVCSAVVEVYQSLAQQIVRDGEGATKFVTVNVDGGASAQECLNVAYAVAHSPLIKTAMFASDPNWGRIVAAIGYADIDALDANLVKVALDNVAIVEDGGGAHGYKEEDGKRVFSKAEFSVNIHLGRGNFSETIWTSDLSHEYVTINAEYRT